MALCDFLLLVFISLLASGADAKVITLQNKCNTTIWPGFQVGTASDPTQTMEGGFELRPGETVNVTAEHYATVWGRNGCSFDHSGDGKCVTGDCGGVLRCAEATQNFIPVLPVTFAVLNFYNVLPDFYAVSVANGFNLPISVSPYGHQAGAGECKASSCFIDLNQICPSELQVRSNGEIVACKSPCVAFNKPEFCCPSVAHFPEDPPSDESCKSTHYSVAFQAGCPTALVHNTIDWMRFGCIDANYLITFC